MTSGWRASLWAQLVLASILATAVVLGFLVLVKRLSWVSDLRLDLTADGTYAVASEDQALLRGLNAPVRATLIVGFDADIQQRVLDAQGEPRADLLQRYYRPILDDARHRVQRVLDEWSHVSPEFTWTVVDGESEPRRAAVLAESLGITPEESLNRVILVQGSERREVPLRRMMRDIQWGSFPSWPGAQAAPPLGPAGWTVSEELSAALRALSSGERIKIGIAAGTKSFAEPGSEVHRGLVRTLMAEGYACEVLELSREEDLSRFAAVIVPAPRILLDRKLTSALRAYDQSGGRLLLLSDPRFEEDYRQILEPYGTVLQPVMVEDRLLAEPARSGPQELQSMRFCVGKHGIDAPLKDRIPLYLGMSRAIQFLEQHAAGVEQVPLLCVSREAESIPVRADAARGTSEPLPAERRASPSAAVAGALTRRVQGGARESRVVLFGSVGILAPDELTLSSHFGNRDLVLNCMSWLTDRPFAAPTLARAEGRVRLVSVAAYERPVRWLGVVGLPLVAMVTALAVWLSRRSSG